MRRLFPVTDETPAADPRRPAAERAGSGPGASAGASPEGGPGTAPGSRSDARGQRDSGPVRDRADGSWSLAELAAAYAYPEPAAQPVAGSAAGSAAGGRKQWLRANMVSTLDGAAQHDGRSQGISCPSDMRIFGTLRALADAVLVGAETVRQEGYRPARAREDFAAARAAAGQAPAPAIAIVTAGLDLDLALPLFTAPLVPTVILTGASAPQDRVAAAEKAGVRVVVAGDGQGVDPARAVRELAGLGHTRLLTEGGPRLLGQLVAADVLDEICLTLSPMLTAGDAQRIAGGPRVEVPRRFVLASLLEEDGFLFSRYRRP